MLNLIIFEGYTFRRAAGDFKVSLNATSLGNSKSFASAAPRQRDGTSVGSLKPLARQRHVSPNSFKTFGHAARRNLRSKSKKSLSFVKKLDSYATGCQYTLLYNIYQRKAPNSITKLLDRIFLISNLDIIRMYINW